MELWWTLGTLEAGLNACAYNGITKEENAVLLMINITLSFKCLDAQFPVCGAFVGSGTIVLDEEHYLRKALKFIASLYLCLRMCSLCLCPQSTGSEIHRQTGRCRKEPHKWLLKMPNFLYFFSPFHPENKVLTGFFSH